jgi:hypothetical protein
MKSVTPLSGSLLPLFLALFATGAAAQGSDSCSTAQVIAGPGPHAFDLNSATTGTDGQSAGACNFFGSTAILSDVWFRWTAPSSGVFAVTTCGQTSVDTKLAVYAGTSCPPGAPIGCEDDWGAVQALVQFSAAAGSTFTFQLGTSPFGSPGTGTLRVLPVPNSASDECTLPVTVTGTGFFAFDNTLAATGTQGQSNPGCVPVILDVWYSWTAPITGMATLDTCGQTPSDSRIAVYAGSGCPAATSLACDDDACGLQSLVQWPVAAGSSYMLQIGGQSFTSGSYGTFRLEVTGVPANDSCATPAAANQGGAQYDNTTATTGAEGQGNPCGPIDHDLWFTWTASVTGSASIDTCGQTSVNTSLAVYGGVGCPAGAALACNDNGCGGTDQSEVTIPITAGSSYTIQIGSSLGAPGGPSSFSIIETSSGSGPLTPFCFPGQGAIIACPCGNPPTAVGRGCDNFGAGPAASAQLSGSGTASLTADTVALSVTGENNSSLTVFFQGRDPIHPTGLVHGAGVRCVTATLKRLYTGNASAGSISRPGMGDPSVSARSAAVGDTILSGQNRHYFTIYRDPNAAGACGNTSSTVNVSNAGTVFWAP